MSKRRELDLALETTHAKVRIGNTGICQFLRQEVKGMAMRALDIHETKAMRMPWILVLLTAKRNRKGRLRRLGDIIQIRKRIAEPVPGIAVDAEPGPEPPVEPGLI